MSMVAIDSISKEESGYAAYLTTEMENLGP